MILSIKLKGCQPHILEMIDPEQNTTLAIKAYERCIKVKRIITEHASSKSAQTTVTSQKLEKASWLR